MKYIKKLIIIFFLSSCFNLHPRSINTKLSAKISQKAEAGNIKINPLTPNIRKDMTIYVHESNTKPPSPIFSLIWDKFSLMDIKLARTNFFVNSLIRDKNFTLNGIQERFGKTKVIIPKEHIDGNSICYKDNKKNIVVNFYESFINPPGLQSYKVSKEKDVKDCLIIDLKNAETKLGLKIGMKRKELEKIFSMEPFKSAIKLNSIEKAYEFSPDEVTLTSVMVNNREQLFYIIEDQWKERCSERGFLDQNDKEGYCYFGIILTIDISFKSNKVSSFTISAGIST